MSALPLVPRSSLRALVAAGLMTVAGVFGNTDAAAADSNLPSSEAPFAAPRVMLVWVGTGLASVHADGAWRRVPGQDYEFSVTQRRYAGHWESVKVQHRRHPAYDGSAGPRDQVHYFRIDLGNSEGDDSAFALQSDLGLGQGRIDRALRVGRMEFDARDVSMFAPFNRFRISQHYRYEEGLLLETVELFKKKGDLEVPFMRIEERAVLMAPQRFAAAPDGDAVVAR